MTRRPTLIERIAFWIGWTLRGIPVLMLMACSAPAKRCEFPLWVSVMPTHEADAECRRLGVKWSDWGLGVKDTSWVRGCSTPDRIITNGTESNMGHEMAHQVERNCK